MDLKSDPLAFYQAVQTAVRANSGKALAPLLKRWRYTRSSDTQQQALSLASRRFLARVGLLDSGAPDDNQHQNFNALLERVARASGDAPGIAAGFIELFASGEYGVMERGVCAPEPFCAACPLNESCRYLASGGADARSFGEDLARELLRTHTPQESTIAQRLTDVRAADLLAFAVTGERTGAAEIGRAEAALKACRGLRGLLAASPVELQALGFSEAAAARIHGVAQLCRIWAEETTVRGNQFRHGQDFYDYFHLRLRDLKREVFIVTLLDQKHCLIGEETVSAGSLTETLVHPREVFAAAVRERAAAIAVVHNHPSGDPAPSPQDKAITKRLESVATLLGIRLLDHVIIGDGKYFSMVEEGLMD
jgi:DNA repair protein RadC